MIRRVASILLAMLFLLVYAGCTGEEEMQDLLSTETERLPSLREIYEAHFDFGAAAPQRVFSDPKWRNLMLQQFSILTPENELKPDSVLDISASRELVKETGDESQAAVHFDAAKPLLTFARNNGMKVHGHVLVWHSQTPEAFFHEGYDSARPMVSREIMLGRMEHYIRGVMEYMQTNYPGMIVSWDVLNEAIDDGTNGLRKSLWFQVIGEDYPEYAFTFARKYAPEGTLLYYNDYNTAYSGKRVGIIKLLKRLIADGNIDGYGFQMHHSVNTPSMYEIKAAVDAIAALGLRLRVSELDIGVDSDKDASFEMQAEKYAAIMKLLMSRSDQVEAVQVWGLTDAMSWRSKDKPLLFDAEGNPKPAFWAVADPTKY
uniref:Beta-xylanase n=1 Tax=uncultured bacterium Contig28b TaxID=1393549 RepID=W0FM23_9BACT|nr:endo-1,4-beta-xylanase [uncultured bacterium Contig28b]